MTRNWLATGTAVGVSRHSSISISGRKFRRIVPVCPVREFPRDSQFLRGGGSSETHGLRSFCLRPRLARTKARRGMAEQSDHASEAKGDGQRCRFDSEGDYSKRSANPADCENCADWCFHAACTPQFAQSIDSLRTLTSGFAFFLKCAFREGNRHAVGVFAQTVNNHVAYSPLVEGRRLVRRSKGYAATDLSGDEWFTFAPTGTHALLCAGHWTVAAEKAERMIRSCQTWQCKTPSTRW